MAACTKGAQAGKWTGRVVAGPDGTISSSFMNGASSGDAGLDGCLTRALASGAVPHSGGEIATLTIAVEWK